MKKVLFLLILMLNMVEFMLSTVEAQKQGKEKIDSLLSVLKTAKPDTAKVNTLNAMAEEYKSNNPDSAIYFANEACTLAIKMDYKIGITDACLIISRALINLGNYSMALKNSNDALKIIDQQLASKKPAGKSKILRQKAEAYNNIGIIYQYQGNYPEDLKNFLASLKIREEIGDKRGIAGSYHNIGMIYDDQGNYAEALKMYFAALKLNEESGNKKWAALNLMCIGAVYQEQGNYPGALKNFFVSLKILIEIGDKNGIAGSYSSIGVIYEAQGNYPEALKNVLAALRIQEEIKDKQGIAHSYENIGIICYGQGNSSEALNNFFTSLKIREEIGDKLGITRSYNNIGVIYREQGNHSEALRNYFASLKICEEIGNKQGLSACYANIGSIYADQGNYNEALKNHLAALNITEEIGDKGTMVVCFNGIGGDYIKLKKNSEASRYLNKGLSLAKELGSLKDIKDSYNILVALDSAQGNFKQAFENQKLYITYRDSIVNKEAAKKTIQIQMQYDFDKRESLAKAEQEKKNAIALKEMQKQKLLRNALIGGFAFLLILGVIISIIMIQYREIRAIKKERNRISGELHDDIGADLNRITMVSQLLQKKPNKDRELQEQLVIISEAGKMVLGSIGEIIWTMNPQQDNLEGLVAHIRRFVTEYLELNRIEVGFAFPDDIPERPVSDKYRRNIFLAIKEAIYNITKYSRATRVQLSMNLEKRMAGIEIHDNGTGFSVNDKQNWGNGLRNMNQRMKDIGGNFRISSGKDQGTLINLNFPVH